MAEKTTKKDKKTKLTPEKHVDGSTEDQQADRIAVAKEANLDFSSKSSPEITRQKLEDQAPRLDDPNNEGYQAFPKTGAMNAYVPDDPRYKDKIAKTTTDPKRYDWVNQDNNAREMSVEDQKKLEEKLTNDEVKARVITSAGNNLVVDFFRDNKPAGSFKTRQFDGEDISEVEKYRDSLTKKNK